MLAANYTRDHLTDSGILPQYGMAGNNSGFNAIFFRWMAKFMRNHELQNTYQSWLQGNAEAAWKVRRTNDGLSWCQWRQPTPTGANLHSWDCIASLEALQIVSPPKTMSDQFKFKTADGKCEITVNTAAAPELKDWAENQLAPVLADWYPKIVAMLPSADYTAPIHFSLTLKPMDGVAYTAGQRVVANSKWLNGELAKSGGGEAVGSLVHEMVHVIQQFHGNNPGWLVEGSADYVRWFMYEPQSHGADIVWMRHLKHFTPRYDGSYRISANFLDWVTRKYDPDLVTQLNAAMRSDKYDDSLWKQFTGKTVQELGEEWKKVLTSQKGPDIE